MPKKDFWPLSLVIMGFILLASQFEILPPTFWFLWPVIMIVVGLGGLLTTDRQEWLRDLKDTPKKKGKKKSSKKKKK